MRKEEANDIYHFWFKQDVGERGGEGTREKQTNRGAEIGR